MSVRIELFQNEPSAQFDQGEAIFREGEPGEAMYVVLEGEVELRVRDKVVEKLGPGSVLGEMALIERAPRVATAIALTDCRLAAVPEKRFLFMVQQTPHFALQIMRVIAGRLRRMNEKL